MRKDITDRYYKVFTYQPVDRVPDIEFGYWPQTIRRWLKEGLPLELTDAERNQMFSRRVDEFFGFDREGSGVGLRMEMNPPYEEEVLGRDGPAVIVRDGQGIVAKRYPDSADESSIPHFIEFPVKTPADWQAMKRRYRPDDPIRSRRPEEFDEAVAKAREGRRIILWLSGFYGQIRNWMGFEGLSLALYDWPAMIHDMVEHWSQMAAGQIEAMPEEVVIDEVCWWEDMAGRNGPFVGPAMFREFFQPGYRRVMRAAQKRGAVLSHVDCDGNPHDIVANWLAEGVNIMFPLEVAAGVDPFAWREEFGLDVRLRGGIDKRPLAAGGKAIDRELERIKPLLDQGGYIPHLDHLVPPDISYANYCRYRERKLRLIGK